MDKTGRRSPTFTTRCKLNVKNPFRQPLQKSPLERYRSVEQISDSTAHSKAKQSSETTGPTPIDLAYLSGYVDGEGCVTINQKGGCTLEASSVDPHVLRWIVKTFGGDMRLMNLKMRRSLYRWRLYGSDFRKLIPKLLPYSRIKRDQLAGVVEFYDYPPGSERRATILASLKRKKRYDFARSRTTPPS